jgi:hypothetical protein
MKSTLIARFLIICFLFSDPTIDQVDKKEIKDYLTAKN